MCFFFDQRNVPLFIPPQSFLQTDRTNNYIFRDPIVSKKDTRQLIKKENTIGVNRRRRLAFTIEVKFEENGKTNIPTAVHDCLRPDEETIMRSPEAIKLRFGTRLFSLKSFLKNLLENYLNKDQFGLKVPLLNSRDMRKKKF